MAHLLETRSAKCKTVTRVSDNLNTPTIGAFYEAFSLEQASDFVKRLDLVHTPRHGRWLGLLNEHRAECDLRCLTSQCLADHRLGDLDTLQSEIATWPKKTNTKQRGIHGHFQLDDARIKLKKRYPKIKT